MKIEYRLKVVCQAIGPGHSLVAHTQIELKAETYESLFIALQEAKTLCQQQVEAIDKNAKSR